MKQLVILVLFALAIFASYAQEVMYIHSEGIGKGVKTSKTDSVHFSNGGYNLTLGLQNSQYTFEASEIDSITFTDNIDTLFIQYNGDKANVLNPFAFDSINVEISDAHIIVDADKIQRDIVYNLSGSSDNGSFKIYSKRRFKIQLNGVNLSNTTGPAINIQSKKKAFIELIAKTTSVLEDGSTYSDAPLDDGGEEEDQKGTIFSEDKLDFSGTGTLLISSNTKHAICSDDKVEIEEGTIEITAATKDGIHTKDGIEIKGGLINVAVSGDAFDADDSEIEIKGGEINATVSAQSVTGFKCDSTFIMSGGTVNVTVSGNQSKGIYSKQPIILEAGTLSINTSGSVVLEASGSGNNPSYCTAIKGDSTLYLNGTDLTIIGSGTANKGISSNENIVINSGVINIIELGNGNTYTNETGETDTYHASCITNDGNLEILGGTTSLKSSGSAGRGITTDGELVVGDNSNAPILSVTTTGSTISTGTSSDGGGRPGGGGPGGETTTGDEAKAIKSKGKLTINNGNITISSADDGLKSETAIEFNGGTVSVIKSSEAIECTLITVNDGDITLVASDDGLNATAGTGGEGDDGSYLNLFGGDVSITITDGDGLDSNGKIVMTGGNVIVNGPESNIEVGIDVNGTFLISGGILAVSGNYSRMTEGPSTSSSQYSVLIQSSSTYAANSLYCIKNASGDIIMQFKPSHKYNCMVFSSNGLASGGTYSIYTGGTSTGTEKNGYITGGTYTGGTLRKTFTMSSKLTSVSY